jgi:hypothetical protein
MRFLKVGEAHHKNEIGFKLMAKVVNAEIIESENKNIWKEYFDLIWIPRGFYHSLEFPNSKRILYGPHNFTLPNEPWIYAFEPQFTNSIYTSLSPWVNNLYATYPKLCMPVKPLPFPVDVEAFKPSESKSYEYDCIIYFKNRLKSQLLYIQEILSENNIKYKTIICGSYKEEEYKEILNKVKFCVWIGCHESQGFAFQEALSMNVPLLVYDVISLHDEINSFGEEAYKDYKEELKATTCSYWDERCGIRFTDLNRFEIYLKEMLEKKEKYSPREYILEKLTPEKCIDRILTEYCEKTC